ncbi:MAG TPA: glycosyltransferase family 1 protein [Tepidisphaeraceae bacterium]|jgi:glycosyltransferase involved in cell wall biosynthesis
MSGVIVNGRFAGKRLTGVQRYAKEIVERLAGRCEMVRTHARDGIPGHRWEQFVLPLHSRGRLLWSPCNTGPVAVRRQVVTIHDTSFVDTPDCFSRSFAAWYKWLIPRLARRCRRVTTVSEFSRRRIAEVANLPLDRIDVVPNGIHADFKPAGEEAIDALRQRYDLTGPYLLTLGSLEPRKNLKTLLKAWPLIAARRDDLTLAVAGGLGGANASIFNGAGVSFDDLPRVKRLGYVDDADLPALYSGATAFVFPSVYEGFGLPPLEAMACGTPVVCSNATALPEVVGEAAVTFDPLDVEEMAHAVLRVLEDTALRDRLIPRGRARAAEFTWEVATDKAWRVLSEAAADN